MDYTAGFIRDLLGTFLGAGLGLGSAMWWDRRKERQGLRERRLRAIATIRADVASTEAAIDVPSAQVAETDGGAYLVEFSIPFFQSTGFESAMYSGDVSLLPSALQTALSAFHEHLRITRLAVDELSRSYAYGASAEDDARRIQNTANHLAGLSEMLGTLIPELREKLDIAEDNVRRGAPIL